MAIGDPDARMGLETFTEGHGPGQRGGRPGVLQGIQRLIPSPVAAPLVVAGLPVVFHLLDVGAVFQHQGHQVPGGRRAVHRAPEPLCRHARQQARVIDMGVGEQDERQVRGAVVVGFEVAGFDGRVALMHAAIHGEADARGLDGEARARYRAGRAEKGDVHTRPGI